MMQAWATKGSHFAGKVLDDQIRGEVGQCGRGTLAASACCSRNAEDDGEADAKARGSSPPYKGQMPFTRMKCFSSAAASNLQEQCGCQTKFFADFLFDSSCVKFARTAGHIAFLWIQ